MEELKTKIIVNEEKTNVETQISLSELGRHIAEQTDEEQACFFDAFFKEFYSWEIHESIFQRDNVYECLSDAGKNFFKRFGAV